jgi:hypothetical protein
VTRVRQNSVHLGKERIELRRIGAPVPVDFPADICPDGTDLDLNAVKVGFVATLCDLSMLFFVIDDHPDAKNALCVDFQGPNSGVFDYIVSGGAGRFEGATGRFTVSVNASWDVSEPLSAEVGEIVGTIELP